MSIDEKPGSCAITMLEAPPLAPDALPDVPDEPPAVVVEPVASLLPVVPVVLPAVPASAAVDPDAPAVSVVPEPEVPVLPEAWFCMEPDAASKPLR